MVQWLGYGLDGAVFEFRYGQENCVFFKTSRSAVGPTKPIVQWAPEFFPLHEEYGASSQPLTTNQLRG
jgi:hypothetical protein